MVAIEAKHPLPAETPPRHLARRGLFSHKSRKDLSGWKFGVWACTAACTVVLVANIAVTIFARVKYHRSSDGLHIIHEGSCTYAKRFNLLLHLLINIVSTILLAASNYCMQTLSSPTREEVDGAHSKFKWLSIGVPSVRNLRFIDRRRIWLWVFICLASVPLHLLFNSAVLSSVSAHQYSILAVSANYEDQTANWTAGLSLGEAETARVVQMQRDYPTYERLEKDSCIKQYGTQYLRARRNVILVSQANASDAGRVGLSYKYSTPRWYPYKPEDPFKWICDKVDDPHCDINSVLREPNWTVAAGEPVEYCLSENVAEQCQVYFNFPVMVAIIIANLVKVICMWLAGREHKDPALVTIGDAIASFLKVPDQTTKNKCLATKEGFNARNWDDRIPKQWIPRQYFWFQAVTRGRWILFIVMSLGSVAVCSFLLGKATMTLAERGAPTGPKELWATGFGAVNIFSIIGPEVDYGRTPYTVKTVLGAAALVNMPQLILSLNYFVLNGIITCMLATDEWIRFAVVWKPLQFAPSGEPLRVSSPSGQQRSTYFLQVPYAYGIPLVSFSALLHWLLSQSFFLARVVALEDGRENVENSNTLFGFSAIALIFTTTMAFILVFGVLLLGFRVIKPSMPLAATCSATISAACHHREAGEGEIALKPLRWGCVGTDEEGVGHCAFSSGNEIEAVAPGAWYR